MSEAHGSDKQTNNRALATIKVMTLSLSNQKRRKTAEQRAYNW